MCPQLPGMGLEREGLTSLYTWVRTDLLQLLHTTSITGPRFHVVVIIMHVFEKLQCIHELFKCIFSPQAHLGSEWPRQLWAG